MSETLKKLKRRRDELSYEYTPVYDLSKDDEGYAVYDFRKDANNFLPSLAKAIDALEFYADQRHIYYEDFMEGIKPGKYGYEEACNQQEAYEEAIDSYENGAHASETLKEIKAELGIE